MSHEQTDTSTRRQALRRAVAAGGVGAAAALAAPAVSDADPPAADYALLGSDGTVGGPSGSPLTSAVVTATLSTGLPDPAVGQSGRLLAESGNVAVVNEALNACDAGYLTQGSEDDQHPQLQAFLTAIGSAVGGGGKGFIPGGVYHMGNGQVTFPGVSCEVVGEGGPLGYGFGSYGTQLVWDSDVSAAPHTEYGLTLGTAGSRQKLSKLTLRGPTIYSNQPGGLKCALGGINAGNGSTLEDIYLNAFGTGVGWGGGMSYDHCSSARVVVEGCGFGYHLLPGSGGAGDFHHIGVWMNGSIAALGTSQSSSSGLGGSNWINCSFVGAPFGIYRYADGSGHQADFIDATGFYGVSFEGCEHAAIYDELWLDGRYGSQIGNSIFTWGAGYNSPGDSPDNYWGKDFTVESVSGSEIVVTDGSGFVFRPGMTVTGAGFAAETTVTSVAGTWPWTSATLTLSSAPTGTPSSCTVAQPKLGAFVANSIHNNDFFGAVPNTSGYPVLRAYMLKNNTYMDAESAYLYATSYPLTGGAGYGNIWGRHDSECLGSAFSNDAIAQGDLVMNRDGYTGESLRCDGSRKPLGAALLAAASGTSYDYVIRGYRYGSITPIANNRSADDIAAHALLKLDLANPGGVTTATSLADGPAIGVNGSSVLFAGTAGAISELWL